MTSFEEYLEEFKKEIEKGYKERTMATALAEYIHDRPDKTLIKFYKLDGPLKASGLSTGGQLTAINVTSRSVQPLNAGFTLDLKDWADDPERTYMEMLMHQLGCDLAEREYYIIVNGMLNCVGNTINSAQKGKLSKGDISQAHNWIGAQGVYADSVIMHIDQKVEFEKSGELFYPDKIPLGCVPQEKRGAYYAGWIGAVNVYWNRFTKDYAVVFSGREIVFERAPLKVEFDNMTHPTMLILTKWCAAAPLFDQAVVKIQL